MRHSLFKFLALFCLAFTSAQNVDISGTIQDESGTPIPGVNIIVKNTTKGSVSDFDGNFTVAGVDIGSTLTFSYIGYVSQELVVKNNSKLKFNYYFSSPLHHFIQVKTIRFLFTILDSSHHLIWQLNL